jgi:phage terminase large subunit-like protein
VAGSRAKASIGKRTRARRGSLQKRVVLSAGAAETAPHVYSAQRYIADVLGGKIPACKWVRAACQRQLDDLGKQVSAAYPWRFDSGRAERVCKFVELCPHIKGPLRGQLMRLEPWQCFILTTVFGWVSKANNARRFREAYTEVPGGNGKSALSSPVGLYMLAADGEGGAEIYSAATTRDQARIVFGVAQAMARDMPKFRARFGVEVLAHTICQQRSASRFSALSSEAGTSEGINVYLAIIDELHKHKTRDVYDTIKNHTGKRSQPLVWTITTAGTDRAGICYEVRKYVTKILDRVCEDDQLFGIVYTIDDEDEWSDPASWAKANPNWGISVFPDAIAAEARQALQMPSKQPAFKTKHLDVWCSADHAWMDMQRWAKCADPSLDEADFSGQPCVLGLDLASKLDLLAKVKLFWKHIEEPAANGKEAQKKLHYYFFGDYWTPEERVEQSSNSQYKGWVIEGKLHTCPGETNDYDVVEEAIRSDCRSYEVLEVAHDPYQAQQFVNHLMPEGIKMVEVPQLPKHLSEPMKELEAAVYDGRFHFNGDPIVSWAVSNVVCHIDKNDNLFPNKEHYENKIDPVTALLTALNRVMAHSELDPEASRPFFV